MRRFVRIAASLIIAIPLIAQASESWAQQSSSTSSSSPPAGVHMENGFIMYDYVHPVAGAKTAILQGAPDANGCAFKHSMSLSPGQPGLQMDVVGYNPSTCQEITATGPLPAPARTGTQAGNPASPVGGGVQTTSQNISAYLESYWLDPANIHVTEDWSIINWTYDGSCVTYGTGHRHTGQYDFSGWTFISDSPFNTWSCTYDEEDNPAHFTNGKFCAGATVKSDYWYNRVFGYANGSITESDWNQMSGGSLNCLSALSQHIMLNYGTGGH